MLAIYGRYEIFVPVIQRYWIRRRDRVIQRYWKRTRAIKRIVRTGRYEFYGTGKDIYRAVVLAHRLVPIRRFTVVPAREFLMNREHDGGAGRWLARKVESG